MRFAEAVRLAFQTIRAQKLKSVFSAVGVFIGVAFLIGAWSIVNGMNVYMTEKFAGTLIGVNTFHLRRRPNFTPNVSDSTWRAWRRRPRISFEDADAVSNGITIPVITAWWSEDRGDVEYGSKKAKQVSLQGATERYFDIRNIRIEQGRAFTPQEARGGATVLVMGHDLADKLFEGRDPLGKPVRIHGIPYRVIGVAERRGNLLGISLDKFVIAPAVSPIQREVNPPGVIDALMVKARSEVEMREAMGQVEGIMRSRRHLRPHQDDNFVLETSEGVLDFWGKINRILLAVGPGLVLIALVVGGIVIMNIMLMAVAERTREIGIRKSLGARRRDILRQFLAESATLAPIGAVLRVAQGIGLSGALISGFNKGVSDMLEQSGPKTFWVGRHFQGGVSICDDTDENCPWRRNPPMKVEDARLIRQVASVAFVAVDENAGAGSNVAYGARKTSSVDLSGRSADWVKVAGGDVYPGRSFTALEDAASSQVVVINQKLADWLFGHLDPIGRIVRIAGLPYTVIGVFNPPPSLFGEENNFQAFLPHGAFVKYVPYWKGWMGLLVWPTDSATTLQAMEDVTVALRVARGLRPGQENNFAVVSQEKFLESVNSTTLVLRVVMIVLSMVGLAVGGVGVVAIMMISVTERTREIGVRKALGARRREILWQFLVEAATLTLAGGVCGMIAGGVVALLIAAATPVRAHVPMGSIVAALAAAAVTGILFGIYPAIRAARLDPVEALRYE